MISEDDDETHERGNWSGKLDFVLSAIGYSVGMGNVWGFPIKAFQNGGASFLFPYLIIYAVCGIPLFFLEVSLGQFSSEGPITVWKVAPLFMGIGYAMIFVSAAVCVYYNVLITYAVYYMLVSFVNLDDPLPWESCGNWWNTKQCRDNAVTKNQTGFEKMTNFMDCVSHETKLLEDYGKETHFSHGGVDTAKYYLDKMANACWMAIEDVSNESDVSTPTEEYFERFLLRKHNSDGIGDLGDVSPKLCLTLLLVWIIVFASLSKGIQSSSKVVHVTATFPFIILIVMLIKGITLDGSLDGIYYYVVPKWEKLVDIKVWREAAAQIFFSLGIGFGGILTLSSYNKFHNNCYRDAFIVTLVDSLTSILAGFAIFSVLGHIAYITDKDVKTIASANMDLAFVAYPDGLSKLPAASFWSFLFFLMIVTLGLDSQFGMLETVIAAVSDLFPRVLRKHKSRFTLVVCIVGFLLGIPQTTHGGIRVLNLMHQFSASYNIMVIALAELVCICYVYGLKNFRDDIQMMIGFMPKYYWIVTWTVLTPLSIVFILVMTIVAEVQTDSMSHSSDGPNPPWAIAIGWLMTCLPILIMVVVGIIQAYRYRMPKMISPTSSWGPTLPENRVGRYVNRNREASVYDFIPLSRQASLEPIGEPSVSFITNGHAFSRV